ncbi:hypothetical protein E2562_000524 [Oryza meyeriana var. granulata]|uniref:F-box/LRR-repeat protein 15/At3g58940/PEG3-like LRR domain-containing protein n=1 Tax=Oryza meyeriana var. granulata TaxID=110450 RepID=A0A6G1CBG2_9ORYZ|nr:hypothetical protein E2562_000524 [Oryza meyeriana var. granulata]
MLGLLRGNRCGKPDLFSVRIVSCHLKHLKLSGSCLDDRTLMQLSSQCPSLEVLELKGCFLDGREISSASLKSLRMVECRIVKDLTIATPNLVSLCCIKPFHQAPLFENLGSLTLATGIIVLDDSFLCAGYGYKWKDIGDGEYDAIEGSGSDDGEGCLNDSDHDSDAVSDASICGSSEITNDYDDEKQHGEHGVGHNRRKHGNYRGYGRKDKFDGGEVLGGHNVLLSLSNAKSLELLAGAGESYDRRGRICG